MIPFEVLTMLGSAMVGGVLKIMDQKAEREARMLDAMHKSDAVRIQDTNPHMQWTRRTIALTVVFAVMVLPKLGALAGLPVVYGGASESSWLWGLFGSSTTVWYTVGGMPITPSDTHALAAVIGLYFGGRR